jgi:hypothetical protein
MRIKSKQDIIDFAKKHSKQQTAELLQIMSKKVELYQALTTYPGNVLLEEITDSWATLFQKIVDISANEEEKIEFKVVHRLLTTWAKRVSDVMDFETNE